MLSRSATLAPRRQRAARPGRRAQRLAALAALLALAAAVLAACGGSKPQPPAVAARVNGVAIPRSEVTRLEKVGTLTGQPVTEKVAVEQLVAEELIRQQAKRLGTSVLDPAVQQRLNEYVKQVGGQATLERRLEKLHLTVGDLRTSIAAALLGERLQATMFKDRTASRADALAFCRKNVPLFTQPAGVDLGLIQMRVERGAQDVIARIRAGQSFESAARQFSIDPESADNGGRVGWVRVDSLPAPLAKAVADLPLNTLSKPVQAGPGWYVVRVYGRRAASTMSFSQVRGPIRDELTRRKQAAALQKWVKQERARADVQILL